MCETSRYLVEDVASLPTELPKIYERWVVRAAALPRDGDLITHPRT